jgi:hypothetical protein
LNEATKNLNGFGRAAFPGHWRREASYMKRRYGAVNGKRCVASAIMPPHLLAGRGISMRLSCLRLDKIEYECENTYILILDD